MNVSLYTLTYGPLLAVDNADTNSDLESKRDDPYKMFRKGMKGRVNNLNFEEATLRKDSPLHAIALAELSGLNDETE